MKVTTPSIKNPSSPKATATGFGSQKERTPSITPKVSKGTCRGGGAMTKSKSFTSC